MKWNEWNEWNDESQFWVFDPDENFICYRGCLILKWYIGKKLQKNFLMGLKIWWSWGSRFFFSKTPIVGRLSNFHAKLQFLRGWVLFLSKKMTIFWDFLSFVPKLWNQGSRRSVAKLIKPAKAGQPASQHPSQYTSQAATLHTNILTTLGYQHFISSRTI